MKKLKRDEVNWQEVKLLTGGADGIVLKYSYLQKVQARQFIKGITSDNDLEPHSDLVRIFDQFVLIVAKAESIDYARKILDLPGFEPTDAQRSMTEEAVKHELLEVSVTGIKIIEKKDEVGVVITFDKEDDQGELSKGRKTNWIGTGNIIYGVEEEVGELIKQLAEEAYKYEFETKHADFEQMTMDLDPEEDKNEEIEEAKVVDETPAEK